MARKSVAAQATTGTEYVALIYGTCTAPIRHRVGALRSKQERNEALCDYSSE
jgi:hypothetical protein